MSLEITGKIYAVSDVIFVSDKFKKREFVLEITDNNFTNYVKFQLSQKNVDIITRYGIGQNIKVSFNLKGNKTEKNGKEIIFGSIDVWKIENA